MSLPGHEKDRRPGKGAAGGAGGTSPEAMRPAQGGAAVGQRGTVKWFNLHKGFGFIRPATGGADVFVHISALQKGGLYALEERQAVGFDLEQDPDTGRSSAINVRILP